MAFKPIPVVRLSRLTDKPKVRYPTIPTKNVSFSSLNEDIIKFTPINTNIKATRILKLIIIYFYNNH